MNTSTHRREARAKARNLALATDPQQLDNWRDGRESRAHCLDRLLRLIEICPFAALAYMGA